ncbi:MAG: chain length determinant protein EpsF [Sulfuricella sp.]|nr:chain length determinant protein EpsF [Gammaproteobacteria bacterium]
MNFIQFLLILNARKRVILGILLVTVAVTTTVSLLLPKEYTASVDLIVDSKSKDPMTGQLFPSQMFPGYMATQIDVIKSSNVAQKVVDELKLANSPSVRDQFMVATEGKVSIEKWIGERLLKSLSVEPSRESSVITISFRGSDPQFSALIANAFAKAYIDTSLELRVAPAKQTAAWFDQQIIQLRDNLDKAQQKLTAYQREKGIVESQERLDVETRRMEEIAGQVVAAQSASFDANSRARDSSSMPEVVNSPGVQNLKAQLAQGEVKLAELALRVGKNHPEYQRVQAEVDGFKAKLDTEIKTASRGIGATATAARQRFAELGGAFTNQKTRILGLKQQREEVSLLAREVENAQRIYDSALQRYGQSRMESLSTQTDIAVLNPATAPLQPSKPRVFFNVLLSLFLGTLLGVGVGFLVELLDRRVRSGQDIAEGLDIPVLSEVSKPGRRLAFLRRWFSRARPAMA